MLSSSGSTFTNQVEIANILNNYFASIAKKTKVNINYSHKHSSDFLKDKNQNSFFLSPTNKYKIQNVISTLNSNKSVGPNSIPTRILKRHKNDIYTKLADIFNISFSTGVFSTMRKVAKVVPDHKKDSKLDFSNYCPISLLSNIEKILERLIYNRIYKFINKDNIMANNWFKSYLFNRKQFISINGFISNQTFVKYGVHKVQYLAHFCFIIY